MFYRLVGIISVLCGIVCTFIEVFACNLLIYTNYNITINIGLLASCYYNNTVKCLTSTAYLAQSISLAFFNLY